MGRRCVLGAVGLALALAAGCGTMTMMKAAGDGEPVWLRHRLDWTVYQPAHRVALAAVETLKAELAEARVVDEELTRDDRYNTPEGKMPTPGEVKVPDDYPAFWLDEVIPGTGPMLVNCRFLDVRGKTKDGKPVEAVVRLEVVGKSEQHTVVSVQAGRRGDEKLTKDLIDKISARVQQPQFPPGSAEERIALNAALGTRPLDDWDVFTTNGVIRKKRK